MEHVDPGLEGYVSQAVANWISLDRYVQEFAGRHNRPADGTDRSNPSKGMRRGMESKRFRYSELIEELAIAGAGR